MQPEIEDVLQKLKGFYDGGARSVSVDLLYHCYEFEKQDLATSLTTDDMEALAEALSYLWTDLRYVASQPIELIRYAFYRTSFCLVNTSAWNNPNGAVHLLCDRLFDAISDEHFNEPSVKPLVQNFKQLVVILAFSGYSIQLNAAIRNVDHNGRQLRWEQQKIDLVVFAPSSLACHCPGENFFFQGQRFYDLAIVAMR